jgi:hypothetical protein
MGARGTGAGAGAVKIPPPPSPAAAAAADLVPEAGRAILTIAALFVLARQFSAPITTAVGVLSLSLPRPLSPALQTELCILAAHLLWVLLSSVALRWYTITYERIDH